MGPDCVLHGSGCVLRILCRAAGDERGEIGGENVALDDFNVRLGGEVCAERGGERGIRLDGDDAAGACICARSRQEFSHFAVAGADFEPCRIGRSGKRLRDAFAPRGIREKVLAKLLTGHDGKSLAYLLCRIFKQKCQYNFCGHIQNLLCTLIMG